MIGPGTGIAPFRSFWQQRLFQRKYHKPPVPKEEEEDDAFDTFFRSRQGLAYSPQTFRKPSVILDPESSTKAASSSRKLTPTSSPMPRRRLPSCIREFEDEDQIDGGKGDLDSWGDMILYFGCRNSKLDDIYKDETSEAMNDGGITQVYTAVSRDENQPKVYVSFH